MDKKIKRLLSKAPNVNAHGNTLRIHISLPGESSVTKLSTGLPITAHNIEIAKITVSRVKGDLLSGRFLNDPSGFWREHFSTNPKIIGKYCGKESLKTFTAKNYFDLFKERKGERLSTSLKDKLNTCENWTDEYGLLSVNMKDIDRHMLDKMRYSSLATRTASTVNDYSITLRKIFKEALLDEVISVDPFINIDRLSKDDKFDIEDNTVDPFSQDELSELLAVVHVPQTKRMIQFLAWTGLRPGEMKSLAWEDIDIDKRLIYLRTNIDRAGNLKKPKTAASVRTIELLPRALEALLEQKEYSFDLPPREEVMHLKNNKKIKISRRRVFLSRDNQPFKRPELCTAPKQWPKWLEKAGIPHRAPYQLRHTFASLMLMNDANPTWLAKHMGHTDWGMIQKIYGKWIYKEQPNYISEMAEKLGQKY
jgi:integrase